MSEPESLVRHGIINLESHIPNARDDMDYANDEDLGGNLMMNKTLRDQ